MRSGELVAVLRGIGGSDDEQRLVARIRVFQFLSTAEAGRPAVRRDATAPGRDAAVTVGRLLCADSVFLFADR